MKPHELEAWLEYQEGLIRRVVNLETSNSTLRISLQECQKERDLLNEQVTALHREYAAYRALAKPMPNSEESRG